MSGKSRLACADGAHINHLPANRFSVADTMCIAEQVDRADWIFALYSRAAVLHLVFMPTGVSHCDTIGP